LYLVASIIRVQLDDNAFTGRISGDIGNLVKLSK